MKEVAEKLRAEELKISKERGPFVLFALFLRKDTADQWDLLVSAPWIEGNKPEALQFLARKITETLNADELTKFSRIVIIEEDNPALSVLHRAIRVEHGLTEIRDSNFFGLQIRHGYLVTSIRSTSTLFNKSVESDVP